MIGNIRKYMGCCATGLAILLLPMLVPVSLYHSHDHDFSALQVGDETGISEAAEDCMICDFHLLPYQVSFFVPKNCISSGVVEFGPAYIESFREYTFGRFSSRAPPALIS